MKLSIAKDLQHVFRLFLNLIHAFYDIENLNNIFIHYKAPSELVTFFLLNSHNSNAQSKIYLITPAKYYNFIYSCRNKNMFHNEMVFVITVTFKVHLFQIFTFNSKKDN